MSGGWQGSNRRSELPSNWHALRHAVLERDGFACVEMMITTGVRCGQYATDVDHIARGNDHSMSNLRSLCAWHHSQKTAREGSSARKHYSKRRPKPRHPGLM